jgi:hypothetical protein
MKSRFTPLSWGLALGVLLVTSACGEPDELPPGWHEARRIALAQTSCSAGSSEINRLQLSPGAGGTLSVAFSTTLLRCGQEACGYAVDLATATKLLVQPCDMHPRSVNKCTCTSRIELSLPADDDRVAVELWLRPDNYGQHDGNLPTLVDRKDVPSPCPGMNPALACRTAPGDCVPSSCTCTATGWACTADCGPGRNCPDAGASDAQDLDTLPAAATPTP